LTDTARAEIPLSWDSTGHVVVPAMVNGKGPFEFILDTGADESAVYSWFAKSLHLPIGKRRELSSIRDGKQLTLPVTINGATGVAVLDSGARQSLINYKLASAGESTRNQQSSEAASRPAASRRHR
jgi:Aspartyl protease